MKGKDGINYEYRYAELEKNIYGIVMKFGMVAPVSEKLNLEGAIGFGPRFAYLKINATNLDRTDFIRSMFKLNSDRIGSSYGVHIVSEFKLSYIIR